MKILYPLLVFFLFAFSKPADAQIGLSFLKGQVDSTYISSFRDDVVTRLFTSSKFANFIIRDMDVDNEIQYDPNDRLNVGVGATYKSFTLNIGFNLPFINNDNYKYGTTEYLDLQTYILTRKFTVDIFLSYYKGFYIANPSEVISNWSDSEIHPQRGDIQSLDAGINGFYIFNYGKFSYRAAFIQDERQTKSAGSFLLGGSVKASEITADSTIVPANILNRDFFDGKDFNKTNLTNGAAQVGYAHTFVIKKVVFFTGSILGGLGIGNLHLTYQDDTDPWETSHLNVSVSASFRFAVGFNSRKFYAGISYVNSTSLMPTPIRETSFESSSGNARFNIAYRINLKR
ncbi:MAG: DUF4421 domain-containing protein [Bacteroidales bacterium]